MGAALEARERHTKWYKEWLREEQRKVVVRVRDLAELRFLHERAKSLKLPCMLIDDAGLTEVPLRTTTCLGIDPAPEDPIDRVPATSRCGDMKPQVRILGVDDAPFAFWDAETEIAGVVVRAPGYVALLDARKSIEIARR